MIAGPALAQVYRYTDDKGVVHYTDKPPVEGAKPVQLPPVQTYGAAQPPPGFFGDAPAAAKPAMPASRFGVSITSPTPEETYRDGSVPIEVAVSVMPGLVAGFGLVYYVDGAAQNPEPLMQTTFALPGLERGSHLLEVALVDADGREAARSAPITVHMKPPVVVPRPKKDSR